MKNLFVQLTRTIDGITMYRVMLYTLGAIIGWSFVVSIAGLLSVSWYELTASLGVVVVGAILAHFVCSRLTKAPANIESSVITALILFLILTPGIGSATLLLNGATSVLAVASKYALTYRMRHVFNPVAIALVVMGVLGYTGVEWWVASRYMLPVVALAALVVLVKTERWRLVGIYIGLSTVIGLFLFREFATIPETLSVLFFSWPTIFFAVFMLTEPLGLPSNKRLRYGYAAVVAVLGTVPFAIGPVHGTPELALVVANLLTLVIDRPARFTLKFKERLEVGPQTYEYRFTANYPVQHRAGQYLEWTLAHDNVDTRGIRRYFTIVTPPQSDEIGFAIKHVEKQSSWKNAVEKLSADDTMFATGRAGDFVRTTHLPLVCIAGGIGITPFISMLRDGQAGDTPFTATLFFCNNTMAERCYVDELEASRQSGLDTVYVTTNAEEGITPAPHEERGFITADMLSKYVTNWQEATFYISGPPGMVAAYERLLRSHKVPQRRIITDYFPGLA